MDKWKVYKVYQSWAQGGSVYKVGKIKDKNKPVENDNITWDGFTSTSWAEAMRYAAKLNKEEQDNE